MLSKVADIPQLPMRGHRIHSSFVKVGERFINLDHVAMVWRDQTDMLVVHFAVPKAGRETVLNSGGSANVMTADHLVVHLKGDEAQSLLEMLQERAGNAPLAIGPRGDVMDQERSDAAIKSAQDGIASVQGGSASFRS
jgi:hypothetical protein